MLLMTLYANRRQCETPQSQVKMTSQDLSGVKKKKSRSSFQLSQPHSRQTFHSRNCTCTTSPWKRCDFYKRSRNKLLPLKPTKKKHKSLALGQLTSSSTHPPPVSLITRNMSTYRAPVVPLTVAPTAAAGVIGSSQVNTNPTPVTAQTNRSSQSFAQDHWNRYHHLKGVDDAKNALIEDILSRYDSVVRQCQNLIDEQNAQNGRTNGGNHDSAVQQEQAAYIQYLQNLMNANPFVVVIVDGNNFLFNDAFIRDGEKGGRRAAVVFKDELSEWVSKSVEHAPSDPKILIKVYADFKSVAGTFARGGVIENMSTFGEFARGFNAMFDFVDIGGGDVNSKIIGRSWPHVSLCSINHTYPCADFFQTTSSCSFTITTATRSSLAVLRSFWIRACRKRTCSGSVWRCSRVSPQT